MLAPRARRLAATLLFLVPLACDGEPADPGPDSGGDAADGTTSANSEESGGGGGGGSETGELDGCAAEERADEFAVGLSKSSDMFTTTFVSASPAPPIKGDNAWTMTFTDPEGAPLVDPTIVVIPMMPDHGHGTPVVAEVTATETPGEYVISPVNLFMAGLWEVSLDVSVGGAQDSVVFGFCVE